MNDFNKLNKSVQRGLAIIHNEIINYLIKKDGKAHIHDIYRHLNINNVNLLSVAGIMDMMAKHERYDLKIRWVENVPTFITCDVSKIMRIREYHKTLLPENFGKLWKDEEINILCELSLEEIPAREIAIKLGRTENSIKQMQCAFRFAYRLVPLFEKYKAVKEYAEKQKYPVSE